MKTHEQRLADALRDNVTKSSAELGELVAEVHAAIDQAEANEQREKTRGLDLSVDPAKAAAAIAHSALLIQRLKAALPKLQDKYRQTLAAEDHRSWLDTFQEAREAEVGLSQELNERYRAARAGAYGPAPAGGGA